MCGHSGVVITGSVRFRPDLAAFRTEPVIMAGGDGLPLSTHLVPELSAHVLQVSSSAHLLEYFDIAAPLLAAPRPGARRRRHRVATARRGVEWDEDAVVHDMGATGETLTWSRPQAS